MIKIKNKLTAYLHNASLKKRPNLIEHYLLAAFSAYKKLRNALANSDNKIIHRLNLRYANHKHPIVDRARNFVTIDELLIWTTEWIKSFPSNYDIIVGIPRSGLLVANIIAVKLGKPLTTPELFSQGNYWISRKVGKKLEHKNVLLVDDSIDSGTTMEKSIRLLRQLPGDFNITKAALIATKKSSAFVDLYYKIIPQLRVFEWNLMHVKRGKLASDLDGVICENCPTGVDSDEKLYTEWIKTAKPYYIPTFEIDTILSSRLEKYRSETEGWLSKHKVCYKELILWDIQSKKDRNGKHAQYKIEHLLKIKPNMVWESSLWEAKEIWRETRIPTVCFDEMILLR